MSACICESCESMREHMKESLKKEFRKIPLLKGGSVIWRFLPIPLKNLRLVMHSDAAFQNAQGGASQAGYIFSVTDHRLAKGELAPWSPLI